MVWCTRITSASSCVFRKSSLGKRFPPTTSTGSGLRPVITSLVSACILIKSSYKVVHLQSIICILFSVTFKATFCGGNGELMLSMPSGCSLSKCYSSSTLNTKFIISVKHYGHMRLVQSLQNAFEKVSEGVIAWQMNSLQKSTTMSTTSGLYCGLASTWSLRFRSDLFLAVLSSPPYSNIDVRTRASS